MKIKNNQEGSTHLTAILVIVVIIVISFVGLKIQDNRTNNPSNQNSDPSRLKAREYSLYLDGATDDNLINYYKIGLNIKLENSNSAAVDFDSSWFSDSCPDVAEDYAVRKSYEDNTLRIKIVDYERVENAKELVGDDAKCKLINSSGEKSFDLDKAWLGQAGYKTVKIEGLDGKEFTLTSDDYKLTLKDGTKIVSQIPFYPDKVAVMIAWGDHCQTSAKDKITQYAIQHNIPLADEKYPGMEAIYRRPKREVNIILNSLEATDGLRHYAYLGEGDCYIIVKKPILKSLDQTGLPYQ